MRSSCLAIAERLRQNLRESGASRVLDHLLLALALLPVAMALMSASSSLSSMRAQILYHRRLRLAGVHGPAHTSSSSASPAERRNREPSAGLAARGGKVVV